MSPVYHSDTQSVFEISSPLKLEYPESFQYDSEPQPQKMPMAQVNNHYVQYDTLKEDNDAKVKIGPSEDFKILLEKKLGQKVYGKVANQKYKDNNS